MGMDVSATGVYVSVVVTATVRIALLHVREFYLHVLLKQFNLHFSHASQPFKNFGFTSPVTCVHNTQTN